MPRSTILILVIACAGFGALATVVVMLRPRPRPAAIAATAPAPDRSTAAVPATDPVDGAVPPVLPAPAKPAAPPRPSVSEVLARMDEAIGKRDWKAAEQAEATLGDPAGLTPADAFLVAQRHDAVRRGQQRDQSGVIEFRNQQGMIAELVPERSPRPTYVGEVGEKGSLSLSAEQQRQLLVFTPRGALTTPIAVAELVAELRLLRIEGLALINECATDPPLLAGLADAPLRYLGGTALAKIPTTAWARLPLLERLDLGQHAGSAPQPFAALAGHAALKQLRTSGQAGLGAEDVRAIATLGALQDLTLWGGALTPADLVALGRLGALRRLELINQQTDELLCAALATGVPGLEELICSNLRLGGKTIPALARMPALRALILGHVDPPDIPALATLTGLRSLRCSTSPRPGPDGKTPMAIDLTAWSALTALEDLELGIPANAICDIRGLERLAAKRLSLMGSGIGDRHVADLRRLPRLESLRLASTSIDDTGAAQLASAAGLRNLDLMGNPALTGSCLPALLAAPGLRSVRLDGSKLDEAVVLASRDAGRLERFFFRGAKRPSPALVAHVAAWPGMVQVDLDITGMARDDFERLQQGNARRKAGAPPPPLPDPGF